MAEDSPPDQPIHDRNGRGQVDRREPMDVTGHDLPAVDLRPDRTAEHLVARRSDLPPIDPIGLRRDVDDLLDPGL